MANETREWAEGWLSVARFAPYLDACDGAVDKAIELYEWNISLGQVLMRDISHFEVALRNSYDRLMTERWQGKQSWLLDNRSPVRAPLMRTAKKGLLDANRINRSIIDNAVMSLSKEFSHGSLVASLMLGFWVHLTDRTREMSVWRTNLYLAWPKGTDRAKLQQRLDAILKTRNRVAHAERLFNPKSLSLKPSVVDANLTQLFQELCPKAADVLQAKQCGKSAVERFLEENPAPTQVEI